MRTTNIKHGNNRHDTRSIHMIMSITSATTAVWWVGTCKGNLLRRRQMEKIGKNTTKNMFKCEREMIVWNRRIEMEMEMGNWDINMCWWKCQWKKKMKNHFHQSSVRQHTIVCVWCRQIDNKNIMTEDAHKTYQGYVMYNLKKNVFLDALSYTHNCDNAMHLRWEIREKWMAGLFNWLCEAQEMIFKLNLS